MRREPHGDPGAGGVRVGEPAPGFRSAGTETPEQEGLRSGNPTPSRSWLGLPECGESRTETPEREGLGRGTRLPAAPGSGFRSAARAAGDPGAGGVEVGEPDFLARASGVRRDRTETPEQEGLRSGNSQPLLARASECGESRTETPEQEGLGSGNPTPSRSWLGLPECGESRTETPEREGLGSGNPTPSRSWLGLPSAARAARRPRSRRGWGRGTRLPAAPGSGIATPSRACGALRRVPIPSCLLVKGGRWPPFHTFPPITRAANKVRCRCFRSFRESTSPVGHATVTIRRDTEPPYVLVDTQNVGRSSLARLCPPPSAPATALTSLRPQAAKLTGLPGSDECFRTSSPRSSGRNPTGN